LYFRLNVFEIHLPRLRDRGGDVARLSEELIAALNQKHECRVTDISPEAAALLAGYTWPGNVRELRNVLERAVILAGSGTITTDHLPRGFAGRPDPAPRDGGGEALVLEPGMTVADAERALIEMTLRHTANNRTRAAEILGISPKTLFNKLKEYGDGA
jgi:DNA-binding NtrC family response regulator